MAPHSSTLAWKIPWMEQPGRLQSTGSLRVGHDSVTSLSLSTFVHWRRKWHPTPVFLPGESQGQQSLVGCRLWGRTELDTTEVTQQLSSSSLTFRSLIYFEFTFVYGVRECFNFIILHVSVQFPQCHLLKRLSFFCCVLLPVLLQIN